jgi:hypothetical protein
MLSKFEDKPFSSFASCDKPKEKDEEIGGKEETLLHHDLV